jgi:putative oxidoreductase
VICTFNELFLPLLLVIGLISRPAATILLGMVLVIQFTYMQNTEHLVWSMTLLNIMVFGAGKFSADWYIYRKNKKLLLNH